MLYRCPALVSVGRTTASAAQNCSVLGHVPSPMRCSLTCGHLLTCPPRSTKAELGKIPSSRLHSFPRLRDLYSPLYSPRLTKPGYCLFKNVVFCMCFGGKRRHLRATVDASSSVIPRESRSLSSVSVTSQTGAALFCDLQEERKSPAKHLQDQPRTAG